MIKVLNTSDIVVSICHKNEPDLFSIYCLKYERDADKARTVSVL